MTSACVQGRRRGRAHGERQAAESYDFESSEEFPNPMPAKAACRAPGPAGRPVPAAARARHPPSSRSRARTVLAHLGRAGARRCRCTARADRLAEPVRISFSAVWGRSAATARASSSAAGSWCSTAGSCSPSPTCPASTWCSRTSRICGSTPTLVEAVVLTHGHEDHTGGLAFLLRDLSVPVLRLRAHPGPRPQPRRRGGPGDRARFVEVVDGERRQIGPFEVEFIPVTHSVPHGFATAFHTPQGVILHSGDFKIDLTPVDGRLTDLARIGTLADRSRDPPASVGLDQRRRARVHRVRVPGRRHHATALRGPRRAAPDRDLLRQPHPPRAAGRRRRARHGEEGGHARSVHGEERRAGPASGPARAPSGPGGRRRACRRHGPWQGVCRVHGLPGRAVVGAVAHGRG